MKKRIYRAEDVKDLNLGVLKETVRGRRVVVGIDVAKEDFVAAVIGQDREVLITIKWKHPLESNRFIDAIVDQLPWAFLEVVMEPSGTYGDALRSLFLDRGVKVFRVSPKRCHDAAEVYDGVPSLHDAKAAAIIGRLHLDGASEEWPLPVQSQRELTAMINIMEMYDDSYKRNLNRLEALLMRHWPEVEGCLSLKSATLLELLIEFGSPDSAGGSPDKARELMRRVGGHNLCGEKIEAVVSCAQSSIGVRCIDAEREQLRELCRETRRLQKARQRAKMKVELMTQDAESLQNMSHAVGKVTAAVLYAVLGDVHDYDNAASYIKSIGLNLKEHSSGKHKGKLKITKRGPGVVRMYLYMAVLRLVYQNVVVKAWYERKLARDGGVKKKAIVAIMRKLAGALWHVGHGARFDATKLFDVARLSISPT
jgi:transposase